MIEMKVDDEPSDKLVKKQSQIIKMASGHLIYDDSVRASTDFMG